MGFNSDNVRNLNKVELLFIEKEGKGSELGNNKVFFYTNQGWDFNFAIDTSSTVFGGAKDLVKNPMLSSIISGITGGASTVIDMERKYKFSGSNPLNFTINGFRMLENDPEEDIYKPINTLLQWLLPERNETSVNETVSKAVAEKETKAKAKGKSGAGWSLLQDVIDMISDFTGDVFFLDLPKQFTMKSDAKMAIKFGGHIVRNVFLKSVTIRTPRFYYSDETGQPIPDRIDVSMTFETLRIAVLQDYNFGK